MKAVLVDGEEIWKGKESNLQRYLSARELETYHSLNLRRQADWLSGRVALKYAYLLFNDCSQSLSCRHIIVSNNAAGVPEIIGDRGIFCSIAHSRKWGVGAVSSDRVGVDIEELRPQPLKYLKYLLGRDEMQLLCAEGKITGEIVTEVWTIKEAVLKGLGKGLHMYPKQISITSISSNRAEVGINTGDTVGAETWSVALFHVESYIVALAADVGFPEGAGIYLKP